MNPEVTAYIDGLSQAWQIEACEKLRQSIHTAVPDVVERLQYGKPHFLKNGKYLAVIGPAKGWVAFTLFNAAGVEDDLFEPSDVTDRRTIKFRSGQAIEVDVLAKRIAAAAQAL